MADRPNPGDLWGGMSTGMAISSYLLGALIVWGGLGWIIDRVAGTGQILTALGMLVGAALGVYLIYLKYGKEHDENS